MKAITILAGLMTLATLTFAAPQPNNDHAGKVKSGTTTGTRQVVSVNPTQWFLATKRAVEVADLKDCIISASVITTLTNTLSPVQHSVSVPVSGTSSTSDCITCITAPPQTFEVFGPTGSARSSRDAAFRSKQRTETWICGVWVPKVSLALLGGTAGVCASASSSDLAFATTISVPFIIRRSTTSFAETTELPDCPVMFGCMNDPVSRSSYLSKVSSKSVASASSASAASKQADILVKRATTSKYPETTELPDCPVLFGCMNDPVSRSSYYSKMSSSKSAASESSARDMASSADAFASSILSIASRADATITSHPPWSETTELPDCPVMFGCMNIPASRSSYLSKMSSKSAASASASASNKATITTSPRFPETTELPDCPVLFGCMNNPISRSSYLSKMSSKSAASASSASKALTTKPCTEEPVYPVSLGPIVVGW